MASRLLALHLFSGLLGAVVASPSSLPCDRELKVSGTPSLGSQLRPHCIKPV